ncbi:MAG TPA: thioredoxin family protein [Cytophagaceae bacterium]|jgi:peroxiredoxin|nr:thioredoxin family protein [Cytophagaceae bacterium]
MTRIAIFIMLVLISINAAFIIYAYKLEDEIKDFRLKSVDGKLVSLSDYPTTKGFIIVFTCNHCPYSKAYEERIIDLQKKYASTYPVIAINSNDAVTYPDDSFEAMKKRAVQKKYPFVYLCDESQDVAKIFGATKTPHVYLVQKQEEKNVIKYVGAIDDNYQDESAVKKHYVEDAIAALEKGIDVSIKETKAIGCSIKWK